MIRHFLLVSLAILATVASSSAQNLFTNGSFETLTPYLDYLLTQSSSAAIPASDPTDPGTDQLPGWGISKPGFTIWNSAPSPAAGLPDGNHWLRAGWVFDGVTWGTSRLYTHVSLDANVTYRLSFQQFIPENYAISSSSGRAHIGIVQTNTVEGQAQYSANVTYNLKAQSVFEREQLYLPDSWGGTYPYQDQRTPALNDTAGTWAMRTFEFTPLVSDMYYFTLGPGGGPGNVRDTISVDNLSLTVVPEPGTSLLIVAGALGLTFRRRCAIIANRPAPHAISTSL